MLTNNKKSLYAISWKVDESTYREDKAYSYSTLARFQREGFNGLPSLFDKIETPSLTFGSAVDTLITGSEQEFDDRFVVADYDIQDSRAKVVREVYKIAAGMEWDKIPDEVIDKAVKALQFQMNWKPETRIRVIREEGKRYYDLLCLSEGKTLISNQVYLDAMACVSALKSSPATGYLFAPDDPFDESVQRFYQLKFKGEFDGIPLRCMSDLLYVDTVNKFICPVDLKTSSHKEWDFPRSFIDWRYMIQAQLYWYIIRQNLDKDDYFKNFKLLNYRFVVVCNSSRVPLVWEFEDTQSMTDFKYGNYTIPNWRKLVKDLDYYLKASPSVPIGVDSKTTNSIRDWIKDNYGE